MLRYLFPGFFVAAIVIAGCGGGSGGNVIPASTSSPAPSVTISPGPASQTVTIAGAGYRLQFTLPSAFAGGGSLTATLQSSPPSGVPVPALKSRDEAKVRENVGSTVTTLVYLVVQASGTVQFTSVPSFVFTLPSGVSIPGSSPSYVAFYDPTQQGSTNGWIGVLGPGLMTGQADTFAGINSGVTLVGGYTYVYALVYTSQAVPTASPAPVPTAVPSSAGVPAYCNGFASAASVPGIAPYQPQPITFTDNSQLGADVVFYATDTGQVVGGSVVPKWLNQQGQWVTVTAGATAPPLPLKCFPGSLPGGSGRQFKLPVGVSERLYVAYAPPGSTSAPNPLSIKGVGGGIQAPSTDWRSAAFASTPFDVVEFCLNDTGCIMDTTQENAVGLPLELSQAALSAPSSLKPGDGPQAPQGAVTVGFDPGAYQSVLSDLQALPTYSVLPTYAAFNGKTILLRIVSPGTNGDYGFPQDWWYNNTNYMFGNAQASPVNSASSTYYPSAYSALGQGYIGYLLQQYQSNPQLYSITGTTSNVTPTTNDNYCASSDGANNMLFVEVGSATLCGPSPTPMPGGESYILPVYDALEGSPFGAGDLSDSWCNTAIFTMAPGGPVGPITDYNLFYLWKAMVTDIARGVALEAGPSGSHPFGTWNTNPSGYGNAPSPAFSQYWQDHVYDEWAYVLHNRMHNHLAYALQYDEPGGMSTSFQPSLSGQTLSITVQTIPTGSGAATVPASSGTAPWPTPPSLPCLTAPI